MSFIHKYLIGHFDPYAFAGAAPAVLRHVDEERARLLLKSIGPPSSVELLAEVVSFTEGYAECEWSALRTESALGYRFAVALAEAESCLLYDLPGGAIWPPGAGIAIQDEGESLTAESWERISASDDIVALRRSLYCSTKVDKESHWVQDFCERLSRHDHPNVRGNAMYAFGRLVKSGHALDRSRIQPLIEERLADEHDYVRRHARTAAETAEFRLRWLFPFFDNGQPEIEVTTYANGWVQCPLCGWRFATFDPRAFREGRCITCRQKLRPV